MNDIEKEFLAEIVPDKQRSTRKKTINVKKKGNRGELECVNILKERFPGKIFTRTMGSGNYTGGKNAHNADLLSEEQRLMFVSDIRTPKEFKFSIEHKFYEKIDFYDLFNQSSNLFQWYKQSEQDAKLLNKEPLLIVKTNNHKRIVFVPFTYVHKWMLHHAKEPKILPVFMHEYKACYWLDDLLKFPDDFFFEESDEIDKNEK